MDYKDFINKALADFFNKQSYPASANSSLIFNNIKEFVLRDGKRLRPSMLLLSYDGFKKDNINDQAAMQCAVALELLHNFFLIHDDVMDKSDLRRGLPALHKLFDRYNPSTAESLAICAGDILFSHVVETFVSANVSLELKKKLAARLFRAINETGLGQSEDMINASLSLEAVSEQEIIQVSQIKTSRYTFALPLALGAILGGRDDQIILLETIASPLGLAFQLQDDILGLFGSEQETGKSVLSDIKEGKKTLLLRRTLERSNERSFILSSIGNKEISISDFEKLKKMVESSGVKKNIEDEIRCLVEKALVGLGGVEMQLLQKNQLIALVTQLLNRKR